MGRSDSQFYDLSEQIFTRQFLWQKFIEIYKIFTKLWLCVVCQLVSHSDLHVQKQISAPFPIKNTPSAIMPSLELTIAKIINLSALGAKLNHYFTVHCITFKFVLFPFSCRTDFMLHQSSTLIWRQNCGNSSQILLLTMHFSLVSFNALWPQRLTNVPFLCTVSSFRFAYAACPSDLSRYD